MKDCGDLLALVIIILYRFQSFKAVFIGLGALDSIFDALPSTTKIVFGTISEWYKVNITDQPITPFNYRTKSIDEIIVLLKQVCIVFLVHKIFHSCYVSKHYDVKSMMID
jgi:hypothetical protein